MISDDGFKRNDYGTKSFDSTEELCSFLKSYLDNKKISNYRLNYSDDGKIIWISITEKKNEG